MSAALCLTMAFVGANGCPPGYSSNYYASPYSYSYGTPYTYSYTTPYTQSYGTAYGSYGYGTAYGNPYTMSYSPYNTGYGYQTSGAYGYNSGYGAPGAAMYGDSGATAYRPSQQYEGGYGPPQGGYETGRPQTQRGNMVMMTDRMRFEPALITINVGETVRWRNNSRMGHTVTADPSLAANPAHVVLPEGAQPIHSGEVAAGGEFSHTFQTPGTYYYVCLPHEEQGMVGVVVVRPAGPGGGNQGYERQGAGTRQGGSGY